MEIFEWSANYATGIREIDTQHAYLFALTNRLMHHSAGDAEKFSLTRILEELTDYADKHFSYEESIMAQAGYGELTEHKAQHDRMRSRLELYTAEVRNGALSADDLVEFLKTWLKLHIMREDMKYIPAVVHLKDGT